MDFALIIDGDEADAKFVRTFDGCLLPQAGDLIERDGTMLRVDSGVTWRQYKGKLLPYLNAGPVDGPEP